MACLCGNLLWCQMMMILSFLKRAFLTYENSIFYVSGLSLVFIDIIIIIASICWISLVCSQKNDHCDNHWSILASSLIDCFYMCALMNRSTYNLFPRESILSRWIAGNRRISTHKAVCVHAERHIAALNNDNDDTHLTAEGFNETSATVPTKHREQQAYKDLLENNQSRLSVIRKIKR